MRVLLVEDDELISETLKKILTNHHYVVDVATDGQVGWELVEAFAYDLIVLDVVLPKLDGIQFCQRLRAQKYQTPVLLLTAQTSINDKVKGLDAGADDYVVKPFEPTELLARIRVLLRRRTAPVVTVLEWLHLRLDPGTCQVTYHDRPLNLTPKEFRLLEFLLRNPRQVFSRSALLDHLWSSEELPTEDTITVHIKELRRKLKQVGAPADFIETVYGQGYRLKQVKPHASEVQEKTIQQQIQEGLAIVWEKYKDLSHDRYLVLEQTARSLQANALTDEQQQAARQAAHKLAGALGILGLAEGASLARKIEQFFRGTALKQSQATQVSELIAALKRSLEQAGVQDDAPDSTRANQQLETDESAADFYPLILVVDDDDALTEQLTQLAMKSGLHIKLAPDLLAARELLRETLSSDRTNSERVQPLSAQKSRVDVILLNLALTNISQISLKLLAKLTNQAPPIPVLFVTEQDNLVNRAKAACLEIHAFLPKSLSPKQILKIAKGARSHSCTPVNNKVMLVDDDRQVLAMLQTSLAPWGLQLATIHEPRHFWRALEEFSPDLLVLDINMPNFSGLELCQIVRNNPKWGGLPILLFTLHNDISTIKQALTVGADDCISKVTGQSELVTRILNCLSRTRLLQSVTGSSLVL